MTSKSCCDHTLKLLLVGDGDVGKSALLHRFAKNEYRWNISTNELQFQIKILNIDGKTVKLQIWDTCGVQGVQSMTSVYIPHVHAFILVYDITDIVRFENLPYWMGQIKDRGTPDAPIILVAAKSDCEIDRKVTTAQGQEFADKFGMHFYEASAKDDINVVETFADIARTTLHFLFDIKAREINNDAHLDTDSEKKVKPGGCVIQ